MNRKALFSTCAGNVNDKLSVEIPFKYNQTRLEAKASERTINCAKLNETTNRWYVTKKAELVDGSYVCNVSSLSYFSIIFTPRKVLEDIVVNSLEVSSGSSFNKNDTVISIDKAASTNSKDNSVMTHRLRQINVYDKVLNVISIILGTFTLTIIWKFVSLQKLTRKLTVFVNLSVSIVLLSYNILVCFGQLFYSPAPDNKTGCLVVGFFQHVLISALFTITTWGSIVIIFTMMRTSNSFSIFGFRFIKRLTSGFKYVVIQAAGIILTSLIFPVIFIIIAAAKKVLYPGIADANQTNLKFAYLQMSYVPALDDTICFIHEKAVAFKTLMFGQWSVAMFCALIAFVFVLKNG